MYTSCKYVVMSAVEDYGNRENIYVFPHNVVHKTVSKRMNGTPVAAGFVGRNEDGMLFCTGRSESLRLKSRPQIDTMLLQELLP